jgi:UPF0176 protein
MTKYFVSVKLGSPMEKVILYYKFTPIADPETMKFWQRSLCEKLGLKGRILISKHGINGTLGGPVDALKAYVKEMNTHPNFKKTVYKWSAGSSNDFPRLSVKAKDEIVAFKVADEIEVDEKGVVGGGKHLKPAALHKLMQEKGDDVIFYDGRNAYEAKIGRFKNTIVPNVDTSRDFIRDIEEGEISKHKDKPIVTYCTGGIRCEILSSLMKKRGYEEVYQMDGGIVKYGERYGSSGYWEGKLYVFDNRMVTAFDENAEDLGDCVHCSDKTSRFVNCMNKQCNQLILVCEKCSDNTACSAECLEKAPFAVKKKVSQTTTS